eukprot:366293-Chlamydomonas_euryale.AAC.10
MSTAYAKPNACPVREHDRSTANSTVRSATPCVLTGACCCPRAPHGACCCPCPPHACCAHTAC